MSREYRWGLPATSITTWSPDTCGCIINYSAMGDELTWQSVDDSTRQRQCPKHIGLIGQEWLETLLKENRAKNAAVSAIIATINATSYHRDQQSVMRDSIAIAGLLKTPYERIKELEAELRSKDDEIKDMLSLVKQLTAERDREWKRADNATKAYHYKDTWQVDDFDGWSDRSDVSED